MLVTASHTHHRIRTKSPLLACETLCCVSGEVLFAIVAYYPPCYQQTCRMCWAAQCNTWLLITLTLKGIVFFFLSTSYVFLSAMHVGAGGTACLLCALTSGGLQRIWALAGRFGAASGVGLAQLYLAELLSSDVQHAALAAAAQVCICCLYHSSIPFTPFLITLDPFPPFIMHDLSNHHGCKIQLNMLQKSLLVCPFLLPCPPPSCQCISCAPSLSSL